MKKILLIIAIVFCIFQMVVLATDIDIGNEAIWRSGYTDGGLYTLVDRNNPANDTGKITTVEIYVNSAMTGVEVATFFVVSGNNLSTRDDESIGNVGTGYHSFPVNLDVNSGDYIGITWTAGRLTWDPNETCTGIWSASGGKIPCIDYTFLTYSNRTISLYGTGTTVVGWPHKWNTKTISKWNTKEIVKWNDLE